MIRSNRIAQRKMRLNFVNSTENIALTNVERERGERPTRYQEEIIKDQIEFFERLARRPHTKGLNRKGGGRKVGKNTGRGVYNSYDKSRALSPRKNPVSNLVLLGLFAPETVDLAVKAISNVVERAAKAENPDVRAERNYIAASKTVLEYEIGKPRQEIKIKGDVNEPVGVVVLPEIRQRRKEETGGDEDAS